MILVNTMIGAISGLLFGLGLIISGMVNPEKVIGFLDVAGDWDPSLLIVMLVAVFTSFIGYRLTGRVKKPVFSSAFKIPEGKAVDARLIIGASLFGVGWGLIGLCPGPAVALLSTLNMELMLFVVAMIIGMYLAEHISKSFLN